MDGANRIFACLEALDAAERPLSLLDLQREVGCPTSSLAATLRSLVQLGYIHHDRSSRTYAPTVQLAELGGWVASRFAPAAPLQKAARDIAAKTGCNVSIAHRNDIRVQYLFFALAKGFEPAVRVGTTRLLCRSGPGWALLTFLNNRAIQSVVRRTNQVLPPEDRVDLEPLLSIVGAAREHGYVHSEHTMRPGYAGIAMPLVSGRNQLAMTASGPADQVKEREAEILAAMRHAIGGIDA